MSRATWQALLAELQATHARIPALREFCPFPDPVTWQEVSPRHDPLSDAMQSRPGLASTAELTGFRDALQAAAPAAVWRDTYKDTGFGVTLHASFGTFETLGKDTPLGVEGMRSFVIYQSPGFHYPMHHHPAEELYLVVAGAGEFHLEGAPSRRLGPGETVFHPANAPHALTTHESPIIAYVLWRGDLLTKPVWTYPETLP